MTHNLDFVGSDLRGLVNTLSEANAITCRTNLRPQISVNGKVYQNFDLVKVARLVPLDEIPEGASIPGATRRSRTYRDAAMNLARSANSIESAARSIVAVASVNQRNREIAALMAVMDDAVARHTNLSNNRKAARKLGVPGPSAGDVLAAKEAMQRAKAALKDRSAA